MAENNEEKANNFIINQRNRFLNEDPEVNRLMKQATNELINDRADEIVLNSRAKGLGMSELYPNTNKKLSDASGLEHLAQIRALELRQLQQDRKKSKSSKRGGKKTRGKRSNRRVTKRIKS